jgi:outer membrane protein assembly factor BamC
LSRKVFLAAIAIAAGGCSSIGDALDSKIDYKSAGTLPPLEVPPDLTTPSRDNRFVLPESANKSTATYSTYQAERKEQARPGSTGVLPQFESMRIERAGSERWLVVQEPPEKIWPLVKDFWQENGFLIKVEVPEAGVMETDWAENRAQLSSGVVKGFFSSFLDTVSSTGERDKFRTRIERGADGKSSEVYISHRGMAEVYMTSRLDQTIWQPREIDPGLEAEFLRRLMIRLGLQDARAKQQLATGSVPQQQRAEIRKGSDGLSLLEVREPFDRAWRRVGLALDRVGFTVEDRDRQNGLYFVRYADPEAEMAGKSDERGLLTRMFSKDSKVRAEQFRVRLKSDQEATQVQVLNKDGGTETSKTGQRILGLLQEQLK